MLEQERMRVNAINDATNQFVKTAEYAKLPTDAERNEKIRAKGRAEKTVEWEDAAERLQFNAEKPEKSIGGEGDMPAETPQESSRAAEETARGVEAQFQGKQGQTPPQRPGKMRKRRQLSAEERNNTVRKNCTGGLSR